MLFNRHADEGVNPTYLITMFLLLHPLAQNCYYWDISLIKTHETVKPNNIDAHHWHNFRVDKNTINPRHVKHIKECISVIDNYNAATTTFRKINNHSLVSQIGTGNEQQPQTK